MVWEFFLKRLHGESSVLARWSAIVLLMLSGCVPENVVWLKDSSGIVYSDKEGRRLVRYDFAKKATRVIVADTGTETRWPAISPDGRLVAVARIELATTQGSNRHTIRSQVFIYDVDGNLVAQSTIYTRTKTATCSDTARSQTLGGARLVDVTLAMLFN